MEFGKYSVGKNRLNDSRRLLASILEGIRFIK